VKTFTLNSSVKNPVSRYEYVNVEYRNDCGDMKVEAYLETRQLAETIFIRIKHTMSFNTRLKFFFLYFDLITGITNFFSLSCDLLCCAINYYMLRIAGWNEYKLMSRSL